jgi:hypothetical protein
VSIAAIPLVLVPMWASITRGRKHGREGLPPSAFMLECLYLGIYSTLLSMDIYIL